MTHIVKIKTEETYQLRQEELRKNIPLSYKFEGDNDSSTFHFGVMFNGNIVAISTFVKRNNPNFNGVQYQLRGMATKTEYQGKGFGKQMLIFAEQHLKATDVDVLWCNAREIALDFYKKLGYKTVGESFELDYIGVHYLMYKKL